MHVEKHEHTASDEHVARLVQGGDIDAFGTLVERYEAKLTRYGQKFLARPEDIEDIVQDVFLNAYQHIQSFDPSLRFSPWLYRIAHNAYVNALRKNGRISFVDDLDTLIPHYMHSGSAETDRDMKEMRTLLESSLELLAPKYREVLVLHYYDDMPYKDIADVLQVPIGTVSIRMKRAKDALKTTLTPSL